MVDIVWFNEVNKSSVKLVGGKGANLGEMVKTSLPVPYGFIITADAYFQFLKDNSLEKNINEIIRLINYNNQNELKIASKHIRKLINDARFPNKLALKVVRFYDELLEKEQKLFGKSVSSFRQIKHHVSQLYRQPLVAVRSSATAEDLPTASFAGQQETYLNISGESQLFLKIKQCWSSLFTERAIYYRHQQGFDDYRVGLAVVVQRMIQSEKSGIAFSIDPVTNDKLVITIEAIFGLGEYIVGGRVTPDHYEVDKNSFLILKKECHYQNVKLIKSGRLNKEVNLSKLIGSRQKISDIEILKIAMLVKQIEDHYQTPQDIEWAIEGNRVFIVQSRPITTLNPKEFVQLSKNNERPILVGSQASPGIASGQVNIIHSPSQIDKIKKGDVLVAPQTNPDYVPAMKIAAAIITEKGGRTSHAAIVSRELGIPAIVGAEHATRILKEGMMVTVNGQLGEVYKGFLSKKELILKRNDELNSSNSPHKRLKTLTKVYVNLAEPEQVTKIAKENVDGIGLLRAEFMIAEIGIHPKEFIKQKKERLFINQLSRGLEKFVTAFNPRPVVYRATDFKSNEYRHLRGGASYEISEANPMLGFRGASRYIANPDVFNLELEAIKTLYLKGFQNLYLMIPFVRAPWEMIKIKEYIKKSGLFDFQDFKLWMMVEVPSAALRLEDFLKIGIDGVSIGTNDLTMMLLGVDRDNQEVANVYDERTPVVIDTLKKIVKTCQQYQVTCSICGQAASDYHEIVEELIKDGATSVSVNPDAIDRTRELIYNIEKKYFK